MNDTTKTDIKSGNIVKLKSGSIEMVVSVITDYVATLRDVGGEVPLMGTASKDADRGLCFWVSEGEIKRKEIPLFLLEKSRDDGVVTQEIAPNDIVYLKSENPSSVSMYMTVSELKGGEATCFMESQEEIKIELIPLSCLVKLQK